MAKQNPANTEINEKKQQKNYFLHFLCELADYE